MINAPQLPDSVLQRIAAQIAERVPWSSVLAAPGAIAGLGESLRVALLTKDQIDAGFGSMRDRVTRTGQWHHQIYSGEAARTFARSTEDPDAPGLPAHIVEVAEATMAEDLRRAIAWVDNSVDAEGEAEILAVPSHFLTALWLRGPEIDAVVVASAPAGMPGIEFNQLIPSERFLQALASIPAIEGLGMPEDGPVDLGAGA